MFTEIFDREFDQHLIAPEASLLHVLWSMARCNADIPHEIDLPSQRISYLRDDLMILRPVGDHDWIYEHHGRNITTQEGFDMTGRRVSDFQGKLRDFYVSIYRRVCEERRPLGSLHRLGRFGERPLWERLVLPLGTQTRVTALFVMSKVRETHKDLCHLFARARGRGLFVLEFERDATGTARDAMITGANPQAVAMTGRRYDELVGHSMLRNFPSLKATGLWERYLLVAENRQPQKLDVAYDTDGVTGVFRVQITPHLDGVTVDFELLTDVIDDEPLTSSAIEAA